jgi:hypothetical protein
MANERLEAYTKALASRGLMIVRFDGHTLWLSYDAQADEVFKSKRPVAGGDLSAFAIDAMNEQMPGPELFPGVKNVNVAL